MGLKYRNILVAIDGSMEADWAFKKGIEIAKRNGARMILVHVIDTRSFAIPLLKPMIPLLVIGQKSRQRIC